MRLKTEEIIKSFMKEDEIKDQPVHEDAVSRQAVEEMIKAEMPERGMWEIEGDKVKDTVCEVCVDLMQMLSELPPVEPPKKVIAQVKVDTDELMERIKEEYDIKDQPVSEDAISRKWVMNEIVTKVEDDVSLTDEQKGALSAAKYIIRHAPSVEPKRPEIIRCKSCRHDNNCEIQYAAQAGNKFFCGAAERLEGMPSVEPKPVCEDAISRQAAIDAIYHHLPSVSRTRARTMLHEVPSAQPERKTEDFEKGLHDMFDHIWNCEIEHPIFQDTVGELMQAVIQLYRRVVQPCEEGEQDGSQEEES